MSDNFEKSIAFKAACDLVFKGRGQPSGYTDLFTASKETREKICKLI